MVGWWPNTCIISQRYEYCVNPRMDNFEKGYIDIDIGKGILMIFQIGDKTKPMELEARIYIEDNGLEHPYMAQGSDHQRLGEQTLEILLT